MSRRRTRRIAKDNKKGGVGKTSESVASATFAAAIGHHVLLIDLDSDRCLTDYLFGDAFVAHTVGKQTILDVLANPGAGIAGALIPYDLAPLFAAMSEIRAKMPGIPNPGTVGKLDVLTGSEDLADAPNRYDKTCARQPVGSFDAALSWLLHQPMVDDHYDYVIVDIGPSWDRVTRSGLLAADYVVIPVEPASLSLDALRRFRRRIDQANDARALAGVPGKTELAGVSLNRVDPHLALHLHVAKTLPKRLRDAGIACFNTQIPVSSAILESPARYQPAWAFHPVDDPADTGPRALVEFALEVLAIP